MLELLSSQQKSELSDEVFRPIHYLGSKLRILNFIQDTIDELDPSKGRVCDLFSGSGSVAFKLSKNRPVTSVDIQHYSQILCSAILNPVKLEKQFIDNFVDKCQSSDYSKRFTDSVYPLIQYEQSCIDDALKNTNLENLCEIIESGSIISFQTNNSNIQESKLSLLIQTTINNLESNGFSKEQSISTRYFGGIYFSYLQTAQIDIILEEIKNSPSEYRNVLLASLLSSASECVNTVGKQFAQPMRPRKANGEIKSTIGKSTNKDRSIDVVLVFKKWLNKYKAVPKTYYENNCWQMDFSDALDRLKEDTKVVYADPPYTRDHYSRFYHVLETISLRDNPEISTMVLKGKTVLSRGLYREERHQSPFCIRSQAPKAFEQLFQKVTAIGAKLVLSYSPYDDTKESHPRVITITELTTLAEKYFQSVKVISTGSFVHSKLTNSSKHLEASSFAEVLIICS